MLASSLRFPDRPIWRRARHYSPDFAAVLTRAYQHLRQAPGQIEAYAHAYDLILPWLGYRISKRQLMHACYVLALAYMALGEAVLAHEVLTRGLELALFNVRDELAAAQLAALRAGAASWQLHYDDAAQDLRDTLAMVRDGPEAQAPTAIAFQVTTLADLAGFEFVLTDYDRAVQHATEAEQLLRAAGNPVAGRAIVEWDWALLHRWRGDAPEALRHGLAASEMYAELSDLRSRGRIQLVVADIALDLAEFYRPGDARDTYLAMAGGYIERGHALAQSENDPVGVHLSHLAQARRARVAGSDESPTAAVTAAIRDALRWNDTSLLSVAYTTLGNHFEARGDHEGARFCFREVVDCVAGSDVRAMAVWALRALARFDRDGM